MTSNDLLRAMISTFSIDPMELAAHLYVSEEAMRAYLRKRKAQSADTIAQQPKHLTSVIRDLAARSERNIFVAMNQMCRELDKCQNGVSTVKLVEAMIEIEELVEALCEASLLPAEYQQEYIDEKATKTTRMHDKKMSEAMLASDPNRQFMRTYLPDGTFEYAEVLLSFKINDTGKEFVVFVDPNAQADENGDVDVSIAMVIREPEGITLSGDYSDEEYQQVLQIIDRIATETEEDELVNNACEQIVHNEEEHYSMAVILENGERREVEVILAFKLNDSGQEYVIYSDPTVPVDDNGAVEICISNVYRNGNEVTLRDVTDAEYIRILNMLKELGKNE